MINLAGRKDCDSFIREELTRARIEIVNSADGQKGEVPASIEGRLGPFRFTRAWYYWVVDGPTPIGVARELYADPEGRATVRVGGHCGRPSPDEFGIHWTNADGKILQVDPDGTQETKDREFAARHGWDWSEYRYVRSLEDVHDRIGIVDCYHIDDQAGLRLFAETIRKHGLDQSPPGRSPSTT